VTSRRDYNDYKRAARTAGAAPGPAGRLPSGPAGRLPPGPAGRLRFVAGLVFGLALGLALSAAFGVHLHFQQMLVAANAPADAPADAPAEAQAQPAAADNDALEYDFFTLLPDFKLIIPEPPSPDGAKPSGKPQLGKYILQAGAFRTPARAERQKQKLTDMGYKAEVQLFRVDGADWYRVWLGPYSRLAPADAARRTLKERGIETLLTGR